MAQQAANPRVPKQDDIIAIEVANPTQTKFRWTHYTWEKRKTQETRRMQFGNCAEIHPTCVLF